MRVSLDFYAATGDEEALLKFITHAFGELDCWAQLAKTKDGYCHIGATSLLGSDCDFVAPADRESVLYEYSRSVRGWVFTSRHLSKVELHRSAFSEKHILAPGRLAIGEVATADDRKKFAALRRQLRRQTIPVKHFRRIAYAFPNAAKVARGFSVNYAFQQAHLWWYKSPFRSHDLPQVGCPPFELGEKVEESTGAFPSWTPTSNVVLPQ